MQSDIIQVKCECGDCKCKKFIDIPLEEAQAIRASPSQIVVSNSCKFRLKKTFRLCFERGTYSVYEEI